MGIPALIAAQADRDARLAEEEKNLLDAFRIAGATSRDRAQSLTQLGIVRGETFNRLETARVLQLVDRNLYYFDESVLTVRHDESTAGSSNRALAIAALVVVALVLLAAILIYRR